MTSSIAIVDYGMSNLHSVQRALVTAARDDAHVTVVNDSNGIAAADKVVFPGQGAARGCMNALNASGLGDVVLAATAEKPFLGICMGLQVLLAHSEENGGTPCLGLYPGEVRHLKDRVGGRAHVGRKIPHMGWNRVHQQRTHRLWHGIDNQAHFYFVHSYYTAPSNEGIVAGTANYGDNFACAIADDLVFAVQFHPEKSAVSGLRLLRNFVLWNGG